MELLRPDYEIHGVREAALDSLLSQMPDISFTSEFDKSKRISLSLATFSILMASFNISTPLKITTGVATISIGDLWLFFALVLLYQLYAIKCLVDESGLSLLKIIEPLKPMYTSFLLCRRAAISFRQKGVGVVSNFTMHGIEVGRDTLHKPTVVYKFKSAAERERWKKELSPEFVIDDFMTNNGQRIYMPDASVTEEDIDFWHKRKRLLYIKRKPMINHFYIPLLYSIVGVISTVRILMH